MSDKNSRRFDKLKKRYEQASRRAPEKGVASVGDILGSGVDALMSSGGRDAIDAELRALKAERRALRKLQILAGESAGAKDAAKARDPAKADKAASSKSDKTEAAKSDSDKAEGDASAGDASKGDDKAGRPRTAGTRSVRTGVKAAGKSASKSATKPARRASTRGAATNTARARVVRKPTAS